jgi:iron complex outermembrane recepter protein
MNRSPSRPAVALLAALALQPLCALADDADQSQTLQEVVVTAQKRSEDLQKVPAAVTAQSGEALATQGIDDVRGLSQLFPSMVIGQDYIYTQIDIRGVGANNDAPALDPAIAFNVDGVYQARDFGTYGTFFDLDRVEVLRGPQGTLYGRNATGGSINVITNKPVDQFQAAADLSYGDYDTRQLFGMVNVPLNDELAFRFAGQYLGHDGYLTSGFNDLNSTAGRLQMLFKPNSDVSLLVGVDYFQDHSYGAHTIIGLPFVDPSNPWYDPTDKAGSHSDFKSYSTHGQLDWTFGPVTLTDILAFKRVDFDTTDPVVGVFSTAISTDKSWSNELRLASSPGETALTWVAGLYSFKETDYIYQDYFNPYFSSVTTNPDIAETSWALFGQATYAIQSNLRVTAGLRYSDDKKTATGQDQVFIPHLAFPVATIPDTFDNIWHHVDWKVGVDYDLTPRSLLYASVSTGYLEGGFNLGSSVGLLPNFQPETLTAYAVGSKNRFWDNRLQVNAEAFYYDYKNYIVSEYLTQGAAAGDFVLYNAHKTQIYGGEVETRLLITPRDMLNVSIALLHGEYTDFHVPVASNGITDFSGYTAMKSPTADIQAGYQHTWDLGNQGTVQAGVHTHFSSSYWTLFDHTPGSAQPAYTRTNVVVHYAAPLDRWYVELYGNNLENTAVIATAAPPNESSNGVPWLHIEEPRTYGVRGGVRF